MAGLYIHIPFCKQKCSYCDFHFSTSLKNKTSLVDALIKEITQRKHELPDSISTIYFGGGTPSMLEEKELCEIVEALRENYSINSELEFTFECNPDDINAEKLKLWKKVGVNRLSIGVQSFYDEDLLFFNRAHNGQMAESSIKLSQDLGFENLTLDLIYNTPKLTDEKWLSNLKTIENLNVPHLSAYTLTVEPNTVLAKQVSKNMVSMPTDDEAIHQFKLLIEKTKEMGMVQYEVSNFGKSSFFSQHNSNYWKGVEYLGFGPSAHSFIKNKRSWNIANNPKYIQLINNDERYCEEEVIDEKTAYNEYVLTRLRTIWGVDVEYVQNQFPELLFEHFKKEVDGYLKSSYLQTKNNIITLTPEGIYLADKIASDLFYVE